MILNNIYKLPFFMESDIFTGSWDWDVDIFGFFVSAGIFQPTKPMNNKLVFQLTNRFQTECENHWSSIMSSGIWDAGDQWECHLSVGTKGDGQDGQAASIPGTVLYMIHSPSLPSPVMIHCELSTLTIWNQAQKG